MCLVGRRGPAPLGSWSSVGCDVIYSERRGQSQKPEEIYHLIEALVPNGALRVHSCLESSSRITVSLSGSRLHQRLCGWCWVLRSPANECEIVAHRRPRRHTTKPCRCCVTAIHDTTHAAAIFLRLRAVLGARQIPGAVWSEEQPAQLLGHYRKRGHRHWASPGGSASPGCDPVHTRRRVWSPASNKAVIAQ